MERDEFIGWAREVLAAPGFLKLREVAQQGLRTGAMTVAEADTLERRNVLPDWLRQALGFTTTVAAGAAFSETVVMKSAGYSCAPPFKWGGSKLPPAFAMKSGRSPDIRVTQGSDATFSLQNFLKIGMAADGYIPSATDEQSLWAWDVFKRMQPRRLDGSTLICLMEGSVVFTHWLMDTLPRFEIARRAGFSPTEFDHVVVAATGMPFHREGIEALGLDTGRIRTRDRIGPLIACESFCLVTAPRLNFFAGEWLYDYVRSLFGADEAPAPKRRIYISRGSAKRRRLLNEAELLPILAEFGFETVVAEYLTVREMAMLCAQTSHVVAPHGAGLANLAFLPPGGRVLELYGAHISPEYWIMSNQRGHAYACLQGRGPEGGAFTEEVIAKLAFFERNALDFQVDKADFRIALDALCA